MNRKQNQNTELENGEYAVHRSRRVNVIAAIICLLLAVVVWTVVMNVEDTAEVELLLPETEGVTYTLSDDTITVKGAILSLKRAKAIEVVLPDTFQTEGTYVLTLENLVLPKGVFLVSAVEITVTVTGDSHGS